MHRRRMICLPVLTGIVLAGAVCGMSADALAQKRPQIQEGPGIWMEHFVADGTLDEWVQPLKASNDRVHIEYSLANDDTYLYLAVQSNRTSKIFFGGVSLWIERPGLPDAMVVYPYNFAYDWTKGFMEVISDPKRPVTLLDMEQIETAGITGDRDSIIYLANEYGIQAAIRELRLATDMYPDGELHYIVEIAVPLLHLGVSEESDVRDLAYRIELRGVKAGGWYGQHIVMGGGNAPNASRRQQQYEQIKSRDQESPTELKGRYRLAPNPAGQTH